MFEALANYGVSGRAIKRGLVDIETYNPRDYACDRYRTVDDRPFGGGPGMVMKVEPLLKSVNAAKASAALRSVSPKVIYLSPQGKKLNQAMVSDLALEPGLVLLAGRYEGVDERLIELAVDEEISVGDFVLSGGEIAAMALADAVIRLLPGVLGHECSAEEDSFSDGLLDCPHYTRPENFDGRQVPPVLLSGNHEAIRQWRLKQALGRTWQRRKDLLDGKVLSEEQERLLEEFKSEAK